MTHAGSPHLTAGVLAPRPRPFGPLARLKAAFRELATLVVEVQELRREVRRRYPFVAWHRS